MRYIIFTFLICSTMLNALDFNIDKIVKKIDKVKNNIEKTYDLDYNVYDPFATAKPLLRHKSRATKKKRRVRPIVIQTILNHKVFINRHWYRVGDFVQGVKIKAINNKNIVVLKNNRKKTIYIKPKKNFLQIKEIIQ